jgi:rubrerythrin
MADLLLISAVISVVTLIVFFVMAAALKNISDNTKSIRRILIAWSKETGIGYIYTCGKCKKSYEGRQPKCPHCGDEKTYS